MNCATNVNFRVLGHAESQTCEETLSRHEGQPSKNIDVTNRKTLLSSTLSQKSHVNKLTMTFLHFSEVNAHWK